METLTNITPETARSIAREAYTYGFPMVESYKTLYKQAIDTSHPDFRAPINQIGRAAGVVIPDDTQFITPNTDTPYCFLWADLRAEPIVVTMPAIEPTVTTPGRLLIYIPITLTFSAPAFTATMEAISCLWVQVGTVSHRKISGRSFDARLNCFTSSSASNACPCFLVDHDV